MTKLIIGTVLLLSSLVVAGQNCYSFLYQGDTLQYQACLYAEERSDYYQYSKEYQMILDKSLEICPYFSHAYRHKSVAYLKSGDFLTWKRLIDKAVELNPEENLAYRAWCRLQFFRDYKGAIKDIETLETILGKDLGYSTGGFYHLKIAQAMAFKYLGNRNKAIEIFESVEADPDIPFGVFDHLHLGILYFESKDFNKALEYLKRQANIYEMAECAYYTGLTYKALEDEDKYIEFLERAHALYLKGKKMRDPYTEPFDKLYFQEIQLEYEAALQLDLERSRIHSKQ